MFVHKIVTCCSFASDCIKEIMVGMTKLITSLEVNFEIEQESTIAMSDNYLYGKDLIGTYTVTRIFNTKIKKLRDT